MHETLILGPSEISVKTRWLRCAFKLKEVGNFMTTIHNLLLRAITKIQVSSLNQQVQNLKNTTGQKTSLLKK